MALTTKADRYVPRPSPATNEPATLRRFISEELARIGAVVGLLYDAVQELEAKKQDVP